jgi:RHS repeat-associated protein
LDYFLARYYSGAQGRFLSPDEFKGGPDDALSGRDITPPGPLPYADIGNPQSLNKYTYVLNNPLKYTDPDGHFWDTVLDVVGVGYDIYDLATSPSWGKAGTLGLDVVLAAVPFVPTVGGVKAGMKLADKADDLLDATKAADKGADAVRYGSKGKPDHQAKVEKLVEKATGEAQSGEQVLRERKVQNLDSNPQGEVPRLCRGGSKSLTVTGVHRKLPIVSRQAHEREFHDGRCRKPKSCKMGVQVSCSVHTQIPKEGAVC